MSRQSEADSGTATTEAIPDCPRCHKPMPLCVCDGIMPIENRVSLLILQHPQEQDRALGTARLTAMHFANAVLKIGLSWPSLSKALGRPVSDPSRWAVLYLGSAKVSDLDAKSEIVAINRKGEVEDNQRAILAQCLDAEMPAGDPGAVASVPLRQAPARAAPRWPVHP
jgi:DTW domain-containing protein YfiP